MVPEASHISLQLRAEKCEGGAVDALINQGMDRLVVFDRQVQKGDHYAEPVGSRKGHSADELITLQHPCFGFFEGVLDRHGENCISAEMRFQGQNEKPIR